MGPLPVEMAVAFVELGRHAVPGPVVETVAAGVLLGSLADATPVRGTGEGLAAGHRVGRTVATLCIGRPRAADGVAFGGGPYALDADRADAVLTVGGDALDTVRLSGAPGDVRIDGGGAMGYRWASGRATVLDRPGAWPYRTPETSCRSRGPRCGMRPGGPRSGRRSRRRRRPWGTGLALVERTVAYVKQRTQFGVPIGSFQAVKHQLADALLGVGVRPPAAVRSGRGAVRRNSAGAAPVREHGGGGGGGEGGGGRCRVRRGPHRAPAPRRDRLHRGDDLSLRISKPAPCAPPGAPRAVPGPASCPGEAGRRVSGAATATATRATVRSPLTPRSGAGRRPRTAANAPAGPGNPERTRTPRTAAAPANARPYTSAPPGLPCKRPPQRYCSYRISGVEDEVPSCPLHCRKAWRSKPGARRGRGVLPRAGRSGPSLRIAATSPPSTPSAGYVTRRRWPKPRRGPASWRPASGCPCWACRSRSRTTPTSRANRPRSVAPVSSRPRRSTARPYGACGRPGRDHRRQDQHPGAGAVAVHRGPGVRRHPQSLEPRPHARRFFGRRGRRGRRRSRPRGAGLGRGRLGTDSRRLDPSGRHQAAAWADLHLAGGRGLQRDDRLRPAGPHGRRRRAAARGGQPATTPGTCHRPRRWRCCPRRRPRSRPAADRAVAGARRSPAHPQPLGPGGAGRGRGVAERLAGLGHEVVRRTRSTAWSGLTFVPRATAGIRDWCDRSARPSAAGPPDAAQRPAGTAARRRPAAAGPCRRGPRLHARDRGDLPPVRRRPHPDHGHPATADRRAGRACPGGGPTRR